MAERFQGLKGFDAKKVDTKEFELPETTVIQDIDAKVFQGIVIQCLAETEGVALAEGNFIANILGRGGPEVASAIYSEQDSSTHSVSFKIELNIQYGIPIPRKAEEIQTKIVEAVNRITGLRVSTIHLVFKDIIAPNQRLESAIKQPSLAREGLESYNDEF